MFERNFAAELIRRKYPTALQYLQERLAITMAQRRQRLLSTKRGSSHVTLLKKKKINKQSPEPVLNMNTEAPTFLRHQSRWTGASRMTFESGGDTGWSSLGRDMIAFPESPDASRAAQVLTGASFRRNSGNFARQTDPNMLTDLNSAYPPLPTSPEGEQLRCPYCDKGKSLLDVWAGGEPSWRCVSSASLSFRFSTDWWFPSLSSSAHLEGDTRPFICLLRDCPTPNQTYVGSEWSTHTIEESGAGKIEEVFPACPFCGDRPSSDLLMQHLSAHFTFLALKCLPWLDGASGDGAEDDTCSNTIGSDTSDWLITRLDDLPDLGNQDEEPTPVQEGQEGDDEMWPGTDAGGSAWREEWGMILARLSLERGWAEEPPSNFLLFLR